MVLLAAIGLGAGWQADLQAQPDSAGARNLARLKLEAVTNLARFVRWPEAAFSSPHTPIVICAFAGDPIASSLDTVRGKVGGRPILAQRIDSIAAQPCHILFASQSAPLAMASAVNGTPGTGMLTVSDDLRFPARRMAAVSPRGNEIRLALNPIVAEQSGLKFDAHLLTLASRRKLASPQ